MGVTSAATLDAPGLVLELASLGVQRLDRVGVRHGARNPAITESQVAQLGRLFEHPLGRGRPKGEAMYDLRVFFPGEPPAG